MKWNRGLDFDKIYRHYFETHRDEYLDSYLSDRLEDEDYLQYIMDDNDLSTQEEAKEFIINDVNDSDLYEYFEDDIETSCDEELQYTYDNSYNKVNKLISNIIDKFNNEFENIEFDYSVQSSRSWNAGKFPSIYFTIHIENNRDYEDIDIRLSDMHDNGRNDSDLEFSWYEDDYNSLDLKGMKEQIISEVLDRLDSNFGVEYSKEVSNKLNEDLSKEQESYFKNSKVRDSRGNLLICYHGTSTPGFKEFNPSTSKSQFGKYKFNNKNVNYFTTNKDSASSYTKFGYDDGSNVYSCYINIENPFIVDNKSLSDIKSAFNIKDDRVRQYQIKSFNNMINKYQDRLLDEDDVEDINKYLNKLGFKLVNVEDDYYNIVKLENNSLYGSERIVLREYELTELFDSSMYEELKYNLIGDEDDYYLTTDDIVKYVLYQNEEEDTNYDGIIIEDILDSKNAFSGNGTDVITLKSSNQIKLISNINPTSSNKIDESISPIRDKLISLAKSLGFTYNFYEEGYYDECGYGKLVPIETVASYINNDEYTPDEWYYKIEDDEFHYGRSFIMSSIRDDLKILYIQSVDNRGENKGMITKLIRTFIENIPSNWRVVIIDNKNKNYWNHIKSLYPNVKFEETDTDSILNITLDKYLDKVNKETS